MHTGCESSIWWLLVFQILVGEPDLCFKTASFFRSCKNALNPIMLISTRRQRLIYELELASHPVAIISNFLKLFSSTYWVKLHMLKIFTSSKILSASNLIKSGFQFLFNFSLSSKILKLLKSRQDGLIDKPFIDFDLVFVSSELLL